MGKKIFIIIGVILLVAVLVGVIFLIRSKSEGKNPTEDKTVTISQSSNGWQLVSHPIFKIEISFPPAWEVTVFDNPQGGKGSIRADYLGEGVSVSVFVNRYKVSETPSVAKVRESRAISHKNIERDNIPGVSYETQETRGDIPEGEFIKNSYILVNKYFLGNDILKVSCRLLGLNYKTFIPTCKQVLDTLHFK